MKKLGMKTKTITIILTMLAAAIALGTINYLASRRPLRLDLTDTGAFSLSDATRRIVEGLDDVATVRVYFSNPLPSALAAVRRDVDDLLSELRDAGRGKIKVEHMDPASSPMEEQRAALMGIVPVQLNVFDGDRVEVARVWLGIAVLHGDRQETIPVVHSAANLEYEIAESLIKVSSGDLPAIAWWEGKRREDEVSPYGFVREAISRRYRVAETGFGRTEDIDPARISALVLISPGKLSNDDLFTIDQYLMRGGRALAMIDRAEVDAKLKMSPIESDALPMIAHYGARVEDSLVLDESNATAAFGGGPVTYHMPYPFWPEVTGEGFNRTLPLAADLRSAVFPWTSPIGLSAGAEESWVARSTGAGAGVPIDGADLDPRGASEALARGALSAQTIAAVVAGPLHSYFSGTGRLPPRGAAVIAEGSADARLFVAGSSRWIMDRFLVSFPQNAALFQNALDYLTMSDALVGIRSREGTRRPIAILPDGAKRLLRWSNVAAGPLAAGALGLTTALLRKRRRRTIDSKYSGAS